MPVTFRITAQIGAQKKTHKEATSPQWTTTQCLFAQLYKTRSRLNSQFVSRLKRIWHNFACQTLAVRVQKNYEPVFLEFAVSLTQILLNGTQVHPHLRQLAGIILRQAVKQHWHESNDKVVDPTDKHVIRQNITKGLTDADAKVLTATVQATIC